MSNVKPIRFRKSDQFNVENFEFELFLNSLEKRILIIGASFLSQEKAKGHFGLRVKLPPAHLSTTNGGSFTLSLLLLNLKQGSFEYQFL